ncbi:MAG: hypothetical protein ACP5QA_16135 [Phycisphaerae bacterium]
MDNNNTNNEEIDNLKNEFYKIKIEVEDAAKEVKRIQENLPNIIKELSRPGIDFNYDPKTGKIYVNEKKCIDFNIGLSITRNKKNTSFLIFKQQNDHNSLNIKTIYKYTISIDKNYQLQKFIIEEHKDFLENKYLNNFMYLVLEKINTTNPIAWMFIHDGLWKLQFTPRNKNIKIQNNNITYSSAIINSKSYCVIKLYINNYKVIFDNNILTQIFIKENNQWKKIYG